MSIPLIVYELAWLYIEIVDASPSPKTHTFGIPHAERLDLADKIWDLMVQKSSKQQALKALKQTRETQELIGMD